MKNTTCAIYQDKLLLFKNYLNTVKIYFQIKSEEGKSWKKYICGLKMDSLVKKKYRTLKFYAEITALKPWAQPDGT